MEPRTHVPLEIRASEQRELLAGRKMSYQSPNPELAIEAKKLRRGMRERMQQMMRVRRRYAEMRQRKLERRDQQQSRGQALRVASKLLDYAVRWAPSGSRREERRAKLRDRADRLAS